MQSSFTMYVDALTKLPSWFHALEQYHYAQWIPVCFKNMAELQIKQLTKQSSSMMATSLFPRLTECFLFL